MKKPIKKPEYAGSLQLKILEDLDKHILYSSNFDHYCNSLLAFVAQKTQARSVFLLFSDPERSLEKNPVIYGKNLPEPLMQAISKVLTKDPARLSGLPLKGVLGVNLSLHGTVLAHVGALASSPSKTWPAAADKHRFSILCESLKKDFYFIREQILQNQRLAKLNTLYQISQAVSETLNLDKLLESIVETAKKLIAAEASSLAIADPISQELTFTVAKGAHEKKILQKRMKIGQGIIGSVISTGKPMLIQNTQKDRRFSRTMDNLTGFTTRSVLCVPMKVRNTVIGAVEVLNPIDRPSFTQDQIPLLSTLAQEAAVSIENARLFHLATTDGLTGLSTIRYFRTLLDYEIARAIRYNRPLSLLLLDIDFFKKVNDTYGHLAGDLILKELAQIIHQSIRQVDIPARYGGEEFIILLPESSQKDALVVAERLRQKVQDAKFSDNGRTYSITISVGVTSLVSGEKSTQFIERADQQLYEAKRKGRNRVESNK